MLKALTESEMNAVLSSEEFGHLGCTDGLKPYVVPMAYVYHEHILYGQTTEGKKIDVLRANPLVCFQVEKKKGNTWHSVICWGNFEELAFEELDKPKAKEAIALLIQRIGSIQDHAGVSVPFSLFDGDPIPLTNADDKRATLFRIVVTEKTGRLYAAKNQ